MMEVMNYDYNNPGKVSAHVLLAQAFISKERTPEQIERFKRLGSMSPNAMEIATILQNVQVKALEQVKQATM